MTNETRGMLLGLAGVLMFSLTLPMTRIAVAELDPLWLALARAEGAAALAAIVLVATRQRWPSPREWRALAWVAACVVLGFPLFSSIAMRTSEASHGAVIVGLLPLATAGFAAAFGSERPGRRFWVAAAIGSAVVAAFALRDGIGRIGTGDLSMLLAVLAGAIGYARGGEAAKALGGWQTICWALLLAAPLLLAPTLWLTLRAPLATVSGGAWLGFAYVTVFSQFIGFFAWYGGMALGGVARVSQVQLLQLFFTLVFAAWIAGESVGPLNWGVATLVVAIVAVARRAPVAATLPLHRGSVP
jgi:drug/metabolite transporter (DMT)-like permease